MRFALAIKTFKHKGLKKFFESGAKVGIQAAHASKIRRILDRLASAAEVKDMNAPGYDLHQLKGELSGFYPWTRENSAVQGRDESRLLDPRRFLLLDILPDYSKRSSSTCSCKIAWRPKATSPQSILNARMSFFSNQS